MLDIAGNFLNKYKYCPVCKDGKSLDTQEHLMYCPQLVDKNQVNKSTPNYEDLFGENVATQIQIASIIKEHFKGRKNNK